MPTLDLHTMKEYLCADCGATWLAARMMHCSFCGSFDVEPTPTDDDRQMIDDGEDDEETE